MEGKMKMLRICFTLFLSYSRKIKTERNLKEFFSNNQRRTDSRGGWFLDFGIAAHCCAGENNENNS